MSCGCGHGAMATACGCAACGCGCCLGNEVSTPVLATNRPGLPAVAYRAGTHSRFLRSMLARLSAGSVPALEALRTRRTDDFSIALLDAWATVADVLTFYDERIANEGYLRTALERRSVVELARLVGYRPRPGVAATAYLAYILEQGHAATIERGSRAQSVPGPGELPQTFETVEELRGYAPLSIMLPRRRRPQYLTAQNLTIETPVYIGGLSPTLKPGDRLLIRFADAKAAYAIVSIERDAPTSRTTLHLELLDVLFERPPAPTPLVQAVKDAARAALTADPGGRDWLNNVRKDLRLADGIESEPKMLLLVRRSILPELALLMLLHAADTQGMDWMKRAHATLGKAVRAVVPAVTAHTAPGGAPLPIGPLVSALVTEPSVPPASALKLVREPSQIFSGNSDAIARLIVALFPSLEATAYKAIAHVPSAAAAPLVSIDVMRVKAGLFGHNAPPRQRLVPGDDAAGNAGTNVIFIPFTLMETWANILVGGRLDPTVLPLDGIYEDVQPGSSILIERAVIPDHDAEPGPTVVRYHEVVSARTLTLQAGAFSASCTVLRLRAPWLPDTIEGDGRAILTATRIYGGPEPLTLVDEPIVRLADDIANGAVNDIELDGLYQNLEPGRWAILEGEATDAALLGALSKTDPDDDRATGIINAELVMISRVETRTASVAGTSDELPGDTLHTFIGLAAPLAHRYKRDTVRIFANVVKATHGELKQEVLGSGDATRPFQAFTLKQPPLTYMAAPTAEGAESTLQVFVNDVRWHEAPDPTALAPTSRGFVVRTNDDGQSAVVFGDGVNGMRLPTGLENVRAKYRSGIGKAGNVAAGRLTLLASRPLGVKDVVNPIAASGGADRESRDTARRNAPKAIRALDRLISVRDYADFAESFAGIGKASAVRLSDGRRQVVHVTIAGVEDVPIEPTSDLFQHLLEALRRLGDPHQPVVLAVRELRALVVAAGVQLLPDYLWESVEPALRSAMLHHFGVESRGLGQDVLRAEVLSVMQSVRGVARVDLDVLAALSPADLAAQNPAAALGNLTRIRVPLAHAATPEEVAAGRTGIIPAALVVLTPRVRDTLILTELS